MNILLWLGLGLIAGGAASRILDDRTGDALFDIFLGIVGSMFSGFLLYTLGTQQNSINVFQIFTVILSSVLFIWTMRSIKSRSS